MDDYLKEALEITRAQAGVRIMTEEEIAAFIQKVAMGIRAVAEGSCGAGQRGNGSGSPQVGKRKIRYLP